MPIMWQVILVIVVLYNSIIQDETFPVISPVVLATVHSKAMVLLLFIHCILLLPLFVRV